MDAVEARDLSERSAAHMRQVAEDARTRQQQEAHDKLAAFGETIDEAVADRIDGVYDVIQIAAENGEVATSFRHQDRLSPSHRKDREVEFIKTMAQIIGKRVVDELTEQGYNAEQSHKEERDPRQNVDEAKGYFNTTITVRW